MVRVFISYSHDSIQHKEWVRKKADDLVSHNMDVVLDQFNLKPGQDIHQFVESAVQSADFVLLVCTPVYAVKANNRQKGVGIETALITSEIYNGADEKFIALLREGTYYNSIPKYMQSKLYVDLREDQDNEAWNKLCEHLIKNKPAAEIGTLIFEALFSYDPERIYDQPRLPLLKRFTQFVNTGQDENGKWYVIRRDPISSDNAIIFFQEVENE